MSEQRQCRRIERAVVRVESISGRRVHAAVNDFSQGGICLTAAVDVETGDRLELVLVESISGKSHQLQARVQWRRGSRIGLAWIGLTPAEQQWMRSLVSFWLGEKAAPRT
jgi:hypothetical protein